MGNKGNHLGKLAHRAKIKRERRETFEQLKSVFAHLEATAPDLVDVLDDFVYLTSEKGQKIIELQKVICNQREQNSNLDRALLREKERIERLKEWLAGLNVTVHNQRKHLAKLSQARSEKAA